MAHPNRNSRFTLCSLLALVFALPANAESIFVPRPQLDQLVQADFVAEGRFVKEGETIQFKPSRVIRGKVEIIETLRKQNKLPIGSGKDGSLWIRFFDRRFMHGHLPVDATVPAIWFFSKSAIEVVVQPIELSSGFEALLDKKKPNMTFRLLQQLDANMRRDALEELFANPDKQLVSELHDIALRKQSLAARDAIEVLRETRLLDPDRFWGKWIDHFDRYELLRILLERDSRRVTEEMIKAIAATKDVSLIGNLLRYVPHDQPALVDFVIKCLDHTNASVRDAALGHLHGHLWSLASKSRKFPSEREQFEAMGKRLLPLLEERRKVEKSDPLIRRLDAMLAKQDGLAWVFRVPDTEERLPPYSDNEERKVVIGHLTSHTARGFAAESAGREIAFRFFDDGFQQLKAASTGQGYNHDMVVEGMGHVRHAKMLDHLVEHAKTVGIGDRTFCATLQALGTQNTDLSFTTLQEVLVDRLKGRLEGFAARAMFDALGDIRDKRALELLKELEPMAKVGDRGAYVRARMKHGDEWAIKECIAFLQAPAKATFLESDYVNEDDLANALIWVDTAEATEAMKRYMQSITVAKGLNPFGWDYDWAWNHNLENYVGATRRSRPIAELARREPRWLVQLALKQMASQRLMERSRGFDIVRQMTGRSFGFRPEAFAAERAEPLKKLEAWWAQHKGETREQWLLAYFQEKGFRMTRLHHPESLPVLARAMESDFFTHNLAVEQISVITDKFFAYFMSADTERYSYRIQEKMTIRVVGWLRETKRLP